MNFSDLLLKIAKGEKLTPLELVNLRDQARAMEDARQIVSGQNNVLIRNTFETRPVFLRSPSDTILFTRTTDTSISNNTATYITFETTTGKSDTFYLNPSDLSQVKAKWAGNVFMVMGYDEWASNASGYRAVQIEVFDAVGTSLGVTNLHVSAPVNGDVTAKSWIMVVNKDIFPSFDYFKMIVRQTSGGALDLRTFYIQPCLI
jgi:hypothetical protein